MKIHKHVWVNFSLGVTSTAAGINLKLGRNAWLGLVALSVKIFIVLYLPSLKQNLGRKALNKIKTVTNEFMVPSSFWILVLGIVAGLITGVTGMGFGVTVVPVLLHLFGISPPIVVGSSILACAAMAIAGGISHMRLGNVDLMLAIYLGAGSAIGVFLGAKITHAVPVATLKLLIGCVLAIVGIVTIITALKS